MREKLKPYLANSKFYYGGIVSGPGLVVFARWPIESASKHSFALNGRPSVFRGDWYVGKSVVSTVIRHPTQKIEILNAHLHAPYGFGDASYTCHRTAQAWDMARLIKRARECGNVVYAMGDWNSVPESLTYRLFQLVGGLSDSWLDHHGEYAGLIEELSLDDQITKCGVTCDSRQNTWRKSRRLDEAKRLDYIFYDPDRSSVVNSKVTFIDPLGIGSCSDHFAVESDFVFKASTITTTITSNPSERTKVEYPLNSYKSLYLDILELIEEYKPVSQFQKWVRLAHFWISVVLLIGCFIAVWWGAANNRAYVGFILLLFSLTVTVTGLIDGLIGFLFGSHEWRALREFETEVQLAIESLAN